jgi:hypothetical protein
MIRGNRYVLSRRLIVVGVILLAAGVRCSDNKVAVCIMPPQLIRDSGEVDGESNAAGEVGSGDSIQVLAVGDIAVCDASSLGCMCTAQLMDYLSGPILTLGDVNNGDGTLSTYSSCFNSTWGRHKSRIHPAPGNHDYFVSGAQGYIDFFTKAIAKPDGATYYSYEMGSWHIIALDANCDEVSGGCDEGSPQERWLRQDLSKHVGAHCSIAYFHQPRFSSGMHGGSSRTQPFWQALAEYGVEMVLSGHDHDYERFAPMDANGTRADDGKGVVQFVVGTGGAPLRRFYDKAANSAVRVADIYGVLKLTLRKTGYDWAFIPMNSSAISDYGSRDCYDP